jgi:hypothetical protein
MINDVGDPESWSRFAAASDTDSDGRGALVPVAGALLDESLGAFGSLLGTVSADASTPPDELAGGAGAGGVVVVAGLVVAGAGGAGGAAVVAGAGGGASWAPQIAA